MHRFTNLTTADKNDSEIDPVSNWNTWHSCYHCNLCLEEQVEKKKMLWTQRLQMLFSSMPVLINDI